MSGICKKRRNYVKYNEELILQGVYLIDPSFIESWDFELNQLNEGKEGAKYQYPDSLFRYAAMLHAKNFPFRQIRGVLIKMSDLTSQFSIPSFSQIRRRILLLNYEISCNEKNLEVAIDGSGMKPATRGDWIRKKWKVKRGWIKVVALGDTKGRIIDVVVGEETLNEQEVAQELLQKHATKISAVYLDGLHDTKKMFELCEKLNIKPIIKIRANASAKKLTARSRAVREYQAYGYENWRILNQYGKRWLASEGIFSAVKRTQGECVMAKSKENQFIEVKMRFWAYQTLRQSATLA